MRAAQNWRKSASVSRMFEKKYVPGNLYNSTTESISFFNREQAFVVSKTVKISNTNYNYWISREGEEKVIDKHFLRQ